MKSPRHILQLATALCMLGLFITIHIAKTLHTHLPSGAFSPAKEATANVYASTDCAVCDYHFSKDSYSEPATTAWVSQHLYTPEFISYQSPVTPSIGLHYSDRGPPALV